MHQRCCLEWSGRVTFVATFNDYFDRHYRGIRYMHPDGTLEEREPRPADTAELPLTFRLNVKGWLQLFLGGCARPLGAASAAGGRSPEASDAAFRREPPGTAAVECGGGFVSDDHTILNRPWDRDIPRLALLPFGFSVERSYCVGHVIESSWPQ